MKIGKSGKKRRYKSFTAKGGNQRSEARSQRPEVRGQKPEARSQKEKTKRFLTKGAKG